MKGQGSSIQAYRTLVILDPSGHRGKSISTDVALSTCTAVPGRKVVWEPAVQPTLE